MFTASHFIIYTQDAEKDRAFFRDILGFDHVDAGGGWLIFKMPPAEAAFHPADRSDGGALFLICDDIEGAITELSAKGVRTEPVEEAAWGKISAFNLPGGGKIRFYEARHDLAAS